LPPDNGVIESAWQKFTGGASLDVRQLSPEVASSWQRCQNLSVDPLRPEQQSADLSLLKERTYQNQNLLKIVRPVMERLYSSVKGTGFQVVLSDETGFVLDVIGDSNIASLTREVEMYPGGNWSEASKGTNAIGTAIFERKPVQVFAAEHYCRPNHFLTCSAAPIFDENGQMVGVLDMSGDCRYANAHTLGMVVAAVNAIESQMHLERANAKLFTAYRYANVLRESMSDGMVFIDNRGIIQEINAKAARIYGVDPKFARGRHITQVARFQPPLLQMLDAKANYDDQKFFIDDSGKKISSSASVLRDENGTILGAIATFHEVAKVKSLPGRHCLAGPRISVDDLVGDSCRMTELKARARMAAASCSTVLLQGESGSGKELVAQAIHCDGPRADGPFVAVNCAALPETLVESELFGYEEGAFTGAKKGGQAGKFETAHGGTLFLDEIGDMPLSAQMKMLRVIQERKVTRIGASSDRNIDIRIIAATLKDLKQEVKEGRFRQDLFYRLNVLNLHVPSLRERLEDIPVLARRLSLKIAARMQVDAKDFDDGVLEQLQSYTWPGNVRELENAIERAINLAGDEPTLRAEHFDLAAADAAPNVSVAPEMAFPRPIAEMEREMIQRAVAFYKGNIQKSAASLGISRNTLYRKMKEFGICTTASCSCGSDPSPHSNCSHFPASFGATSGPNKNQE